MADIGDNASKLETRFRREMLAAQRQAQTVEEPREVDGQRLCLDCALAIDPRRVEVWPNAVRCTECQQYHEGRGQ